MCSFFSTPVALTLSLRHWLVASILLMGLMAGLHPAAAQMPILGDAAEVPPNVTPENMEAFVASINPDFDPGSGPYAGIATIYRYWGGKYGIRWDYAFFQMILETGYLRFGGGVAPDDFNFAGVGASVSGEAGERFANIQYGVIAHIQHLALYALIDIPDEAFVSSYSRRTKRFVYDKVTQRLGRPAMFDDFGDGMWAMSSGYAEKMAAIAAKFHRAFPSP